jgi:flagellar biosynthesis chaperone FliJ
MAGKKKQKYRLAPLLIVKEKHKKQMEIELGRAIKNLAEQKERLKKLHEEKEQIIQRKKNARLEMSRQMTAGETRILDSSIHLNFLEKLQDDLVAKEKEIERQHEIIKEAEERVKKARRDYIDAARDLKMMEKHKELWHKKLMKELNYKEQKELNELGNVVHQIRNME